MLIFGAAIRKQTLVLAKNLMAANCPLPPIMIVTLPCPLVTGYGSLILAEFDYDKNPAESFPCIGDELRQKNFVVFCGDYSKPICQSIRSR